MAERVRLGIIGLHAGGWHLESWTGSIKGADVVAICDINKKLLNEKAKAFGIKNAYTDYKKMLKSEQLDAVDVAVPNFLHKKISVDALDAGLHVLCEKPPAMTVAEARAMAKAARGAKKILIYNLQIRLSSAARYLREKVLAGEFGAIYHINVVYMRRNKALKPSHCKKELAGGGPVVDLGVHMLDLALHLCGFPKVTSVLGNTYGGFTRYDIEDFGSAALRLEGGLSLFLCASSFSHIEAEQDVIFEILGSKAGAKAVVRPSGETLMVFKNEGGIPVNSRVEATLYDLEAFNNHLQHFIDCIRKGKRPLSCSAEEGVELMKILTAIYTSAEKGRAVEFFRK